MRKREKEPIVKRLLCFVLAFAMVLTMETFSQWGRIVAKADEVNITVHVKIPSDWEWTTPALQYWGGNNTEVSGAESGPVEISGWEGAEGYTLKDGEDGFYSVTLKGDFDGFQFLDLEENQTGGHDSIPGNYDSKMAQYTEATATDLYYIYDSDSKVWEWFTDAAGTTPIPEVEGIEDCTVTVHYQNTSNWDKVCVQASEGGSWTAISGYEDYKNGVGGEVNADPDTSKTNWYTIEITKKNDSQLNLIFNAGTWGDTNQTDNINISLTDMTSLEVWCSGNKSTGTSVKYVAPESWTNPGSATEPETPAIENATITMHFQKPEDWDKVYAKLAEGGSWTPISGYAYANGWPGAEIEQDAENEGWYSFTITMKVNQFDLIFNNNNGAQTGNIVFTPKEETTEKWVVFTNHLGEPSITDIAPEGWVTCASNAPIDPYAGSTVVSPEVDGKNVTFRYESADAESVVVTGTMTEWATGDGAIALEKGADDVWSVTVPLTPGAYQYKFVVDSAWLTDPMNKNDLLAGNSQVFVQGLSDGKIEVEKGVEVDLPATLKLYAADGKSEDATVTYELATEDAADYVTISSGKITVDSEYAEDSLELTASDGTNTSTVYVSLVDKLYTYTIYYYDFNEAHMDINSTDLWIWQDGGAGATAGTPFNEAVVLEDGNTWLKATVELSYYTDIQIIPRVNDGTWSWQDSTKSYSNTEQNEDSTIYLVYGKTTVYTELPELVEPRDRYVVVEYDRPASDYEGWNIYSWNTGITAETEIYAEEKAGKHYITVPVADYDVDLLLSFCMRRTTEDSAWAGKDGGDHYVNVPADQTVVKAKFVQGEGITEVLPYNVGYEMDGANDQIHFYYRDDELFKEGTLDSLEGKVQVVVNGTTYDMAYDAANERYYYDYKELTAGDYEYHYVVNDEVVLDAFNSRTTEDGANSVLTYKEFDLGIEVSVLNATMDYNDNNVLSVNFTGSDAQNIATDEIASIEADVSALGVGKIDVVPELMKATISCLYSTSLGQKSIPVTLKDIYGHVYNATATVTITERVKAAGDFDWDESIIYFAVTDRFFDGDSSNNDAYNVGDYNTDKTTGGSSYHGGDFAGLNAKLDYLKDLGVNTIWITPIVENITENLPDDNTGISTYGYHGYWASDFTRLNKHLGTEEQFSALLDAAHAKGMKIMVDVVINHAGYDTEDYFNTIIQDADGNYVTMIRDSSNTVSGSDVYASLSGLPDFVTEDAAVRDQLVEWQTDWMDKYPIDYYRVDTVKHADSTTWAAFKNSLTEVNPDFKMTGEYAGAGYANTAGELGTGRMDALLDFDINGWAADFLTGNIASVESSLEKRNSAINNTATMSSFINSHDEDGLQYTLQSEKKLTADAAYDLMKVAATLTITAKGQPVLYYGEELGQYGANDWPYQTNRYDFDWDALTVQQADSNSIYNHYKTMLAIRNAYTDVFARGNRTTLAVSDENGYDVFSRSYNGTTLYVGMNIKSAAQTVTIPVSESNGSIMTDLYSEKTYTVSNGTVTVSIPAAADGGTVVLKKTGNTSSGSTDTPSTPSKPSTPDNTTVVKNPDGTTTETKTETTTNEAGKEVEVTVTTEKDADGNVTGSKEVSVIEKASSNASATVTVEKDADGKVTGAQADVAVTGTSGKTNLTGTISGAVVSQITDAADTKDVVVSVTVTAGTKTYTIQAEADELKAGAKLKVVALDTKTQKYVLVNAKTYTVSKDGDVKVALPAGKTYELVTAKEAATIEKNILKTVKTKKTSVSVKKGNTTKVQMSSKLDMNNVSKITYTISKTSVATVSKEGKITAKKAGTVTVKVKVTLKNGTTKIVTMKITVKKK